MSVAYQTVIGLEIHTQLKTQSKMFCSCANIYGTEPNSETCPVCLGFPGALPAINQEAVGMAVRLGLALEAEITPESLFYRKHYFYPDLPKGFQITQGPRAVIERGKVVIAGDTSVRGNIEPITVGIERAHLEEDSGKSQHNDRYQASLVDLNRAGVPLLEIVSAPDLASPQEAYDYLKTMHQLVTSLGICDGNMEEGSFRCDANVSVRPLGQAHYGVRVEIKNLNSFRYVKQALEYEVKRHTQLYETGQTPAQETRGWDSQTNQTHSQRSKEAVMDYRYFPEPDLPPLVVTPQDIEDARRLLPELPQARAARYRRDYQLSEYDSEMLVSSPSFSEYFEALVAARVAPKSACTWMLGEMSRLLNEQNIDITALGLSPDRLSELIHLVDEGVVTRSSAKENVLPKLLGSDLSPKDIVAREDLVQVSDDTTIRALVEEVLSSSPQQLAQYRAGKLSLKGYFVGQVMKKGKGQLNAAAVNNLLDEILK